MMKSVQNVISAIQMIYSVSQYYNTSEKISALLIKVSDFSLVRGIFRKSCIEKM